MSTPAMRWTRTATVLVVMLTLGLLMAWFSTHRPARLVPIPTVLQVSGSTEGRSADTAGHLPFGAAGSVTGLTPGSTSTLQVTISNPSTVDYRIVSLTATPVDATNQCKAAGNTTITGYDSSIPGTAVHVVARGSTISVPLTVTFVSSGADQGSCRDVTFPLRFSGTATPGQGGTP